MANLHIDSVFEIAEQIERDGAAFYRKAAASADDDRRSLLVALAEMEYNHERTFASMRSEISSGKIESIDRVPDSQGLRYLQMVAKGRIFQADASPRLTGHEPIDRILEIAVSLEKDSIVFYQSMKALIAPGRGREQIDEIIDQEIGHILELTKN